MYHLVGIKNMTIEKYTMKKMICYAACLACSINPMIANTDIVTVNTPETSLVISAPEGKEVKILYYGGRLEECDLDAVATSAYRADAYPVYGMNCPAEPALAVTHADGNMTLKMVVDGVFATRDKETTVTCVKLRDERYPFFVNLFYRAYDEVDIIENWVEITHRESSPVNLQRYASAYLPIRRGDVWLCHLHGSSNNESQLSQEALEHSPGMKTIASNHTINTTHASHAEVMFSLDGKPRENDGAVVGAVLCYGGNYKLNIKTADDEYHHFFAGINEDHAPYRLARKEVFRTPAVAFAYSGEGTGGVSRIYHKWARKYKLAHGNKIRPILLNSWEGVYMDVDQSTMEQMMDDIAEIGGNLFVMDDGWFGSKFQRNDSSALGDWTVDCRKLPDGIEGLLAAAAERDLDFGIWVEPEMVNSRSELYEQHPEWVLVPQGRKPATGRGGTQMVLDMTNPKVRDYVVQIFDRIIGKYPQIKYVKWDANMPVKNHGSLYLPADRQAHLHIEYQRGLEEVCRRIRQKYPDLIMQLCCSGGGRVNYGMLPWFDEFWTSDNTDALQRVYIQWGASYFFPAIAMACHISAAPNLQTFRSIPMKYRVDVAMSGRLGVEIHPKKMTAHEKEFCKNAISEYKKIGDVVQFGDLYRLLSPYEHKGVASLMYVSPEKDEAVFYWYKTEHFCNQHLPVIRMAGLDARKYYQVREINRIDNVPLKCEGKIYSGKYLMEQGLDIPYKHILPYWEQIDYASRVIHLTEVEKDTINK